MRYRYMKTRQDIKNEQKMAMTIGGILFLFGLVGWVLNIVNNIIPIAQNGIDQITVMNIIEIIAVFVAPVGVILGYMSLF